MPDLMIDCGYFHTQIHLLMVAYLIRVEGPLHAWQWRAVSGTRWHSELCSYEVMVPWGAGQPALLQKQAQDVLEAAAGGALRRACS